MCSFFHLEARLQVEIFDALDYTDWCAARKMQRRLSDNSRRLLVRLRCF